MRISERSSDVCSSDLASKTLWQRTLTIFAGPAMNFILAFVIFVILAFVQGVPSNEPILGKLTEDGAAISSGLKEGDIVHAIDGAEITQWPDVDRKSVGEVKRV